MGKQEIGPREKALREMRERRFEEDAKRVKKESIPTLREKVAAVPARKPKKKGKQT